MPAAKKPAKILSIDEIIEVDDLPKATLEVPEWGGSVEVRALSREEVVEAAGLAQDEDGLLDLPTLQLELVWRGMGLTKDRAGQLNRKHPNAIKTVEMKVRELSGLGDASLSFRGDTI